MKSRERKKRVVFAFITAHDFYKLAYFAFSKQNSKSSLKFFKNLVVFESFVYEEDTFV